MESPVTDQEHIAYINKRAETSSIQEKFQDEVNRLIHSNGCDPRNTPLNLIFGVALENIADSYLRGDKNTKAYKNLIKF